VDDLGLDPSHLERDARAYCAEHEILQAFVNERAAAPEIGERVVGVHKTGSVRSLHRGRSRGATIYDSVEDVCWLLAYSPTHATGERRDVYRHFMNLDGRGELLPTAEDYEAINMDAATYIADGLAQACADIYRDAKADPGVDKHGTFENRKALVLIDLVLELDGELEEGWIAITFPQDTPITAEVAVDLCARILPPHIPVSLLEFADHFGRRPMQPGELIFTWSYAAAI
jgi:hypothetical protein